MDEAREKEAAEEGWYCLRARTRREPIASALLNAVEGVEAYCPRIRFRRRTRRGKVWFEEAMFPGYLFARFDLAESLRRVAATPGVSGVVQFGGHLLPVPAGVMEALRQEAGDEPVVIPETSLSAGEHAVVAEGAMRGIRALVTRVLPGGERIRILMELMGTEVEVEISADGVERLEE